MNSLFLVTAIFVSFIPFAFADLETDRDSLLEIGNRLIQEEKYNLAIKAFDLILGIDPNDTEAIVKKAQIFLQLENIDEALSNIDKALEIDPNHIDALTFKANQLVKQNNTITAKPLYEKIFSLDSQSIVALGFMGDELSRTGNFEQAAINYKKLIMIQPHQTDPLGVPYFDKLLELEPNNVDALNAKGTSLVKLGRSEGGFTVIFIDNLDESISYFDRVLELEPNNVDALLNKGMALFQLDNSNEGMMYVDTALDIDPNNVDALTFKGDQLLRNNKTEAGLIFIERALELEPKDVDGLFLKGRILILNENYNDAYYYFDEVLELNPNHIVAAENLKLVTDVLGYKKLNGFLDVKVHNPDGLLAAHLRINNLKLLNHTSTEALVNEWPVTQIITLDGQEYEVLQYHLTKQAHMPKYNGGAVHYGIRYPHFDKVWDIYANYWMYQVNKGDRIDFVYTVFRPV